MFHHISMFMLIALPVNLFSLNKAAKKKKRFFLHGRLLRNAIPADPGGGVVFFVDPQGAGSVGVGVVIAVIPWVVSGIFSAGKSCSGYS